jgi:hypothetical protein
MSRYKEHRGGVWQHWIDQSRALMVTHLFRASASSSPNMSRPAERVVAFYNKRGTCEQWIKEGKGAIH